MPRSRLISLRFTFGTGVSRRPAACQHEGIGGREIRRRKPAGAVRSERLGDPGEDSQQVGGVGKVVLHGRLQKEARADYLG